MLRYIVVMLVACLSCLAAPVVYFVSDEGGADTNPGTRQRPFKTLSRGVTQARRILAAEAAPEGVRIDVGAGRYEISQGMVVKGIRTRHGGPVLIIDGKGKASLSGSLLLKRGDFRPVTDSGVLRRLASETVGHVQECDLLAVPGAVRATSAIPDVFQGAFPFGDLIHNGRILQMAQWPNSGWTVLEKANTDASGVVWLDVGAQVPLERLKSSKDVWLQGFWRYDWYEEILRVSSVDTVGHRIGIDASGSRYGVGSDSVLDRLPRRFRVVNVLEELDSPGEWYYDAVQGRLYAWLPPPTEDERLEWTQLSEPFFTLENCTGVCIRGLVMENSRGGGVVAGGGNNEVVNCEFRNLGGTAVQFSGTYNTLRRCDIHDCAGIGVSLKGGNEMRLWRGDNVVEDCHIWRVAQKNLSYHGAVHVAGVGNSVRNNLIHGLPHTAIFYTGNEHRIQYNDIFAVCLETGDSGALYSGRSWGSRGNRVECNYIHDLGGYGMPARGVYLDDCDSGDIISSNVFVGIREAVAIGGGRDNHVENNLFIVCTPALSMDSRGTVLIHWNGKAGDGWDLHAKLKAVHYDQPPWSKAYPELLTLMEDSPAMPLHNSFSKNILVGGVMMEMSESLMTLVERKDNWLATQMDDVGFRDWRKGDFEIVRLDEAQRRIPEFAPVPFRHIGLLECEKRPVKVNVRQEYGRSLDAMKSMPAVLQGKQAGNRSVLGRSMMAGTKSRAIVVDGRMEDGEWSDADRAGRAVLESDSMGNRLPYPCQMCVVSGDDGLYVAVDIGPLKPGGLTTAGGWETADGVEIFLQPGAGVRPLVLKGYPDNRVEAVNASGAGGAVVGTNPTETGAVGENAVARSMSFSALDTGDGGWTCEWFIAWSMLGGKPAGGTEIGFNATVFRSSLKRLQYWRNMDEKLGVPVLKMP